MGNSLAEGDVCVSHGLQMLGVAVVGGAQVHSVVALGRLDGLLPLPTRLVELIQQVVAATGAVQTLSLLLRCQPPQLAMGTAGQTDRQRILLNWKAISQLNTRWTNNCLQNRNPDRSY